MICTSVTPCLSSGLVKNDKVISMFVLFSRLFWPFRKFGFFFKNGKTSLTPKLSDRMFYKRTAI